MRSSRIRRATRTSSRWKSRTLRNGWRQPRRLTIARKCFSRWLIVVVDVVIGNCFHQYGIVVYIGISSSCSRNLSSISSNCIYVVLVNI